MSGGHFDYIYYRIQDIADDIDQEIRLNNDKTLDEWGNKKGRFYSEATLAKFRETVTALRIAEAMVRRVDYLLSDDDSEDSFHRRWDEEVLPLLGKKAPEESGPFG